MTDFLVLVPVEFREDLGRIGRPAPGVRNIDFVTAAGGILVAIGTSADVVGLMMARESIASFCRDFVRLGRRKEGSSASLTITSEGKKVEISLRSENADAKMAHEIELILAALHDSDGDS